MRPLSVYSAPHMLEIEISIRAALAQSQPAGESNVKERPILFSGPMVQALLAGKKTQTRRALKQQPIDILPMNGDKAGREWVTLEKREPETSGRVIRCRYGLPGDVLWVRETWSQPTSYDPGPTFYRADYPECVPGHYENVPPADEITWKPSIHMPRKLCRLRLQIIEVRAQRLQAISEKDCCAEGVGSPITRDCKKPKFQALWESINGSESWAVNPWVWAITFDRLPHQSEAGPT